MVTFLVDTGGLAFALLSSGSLAFALLGNGGLGFAFGSPGSDICSLSSQKNLLQGTTLAGLSKEFRKYEEMGMRLLTAGASSRTIGSSSSSSSCSSSCLSSSSPSHPRPDHPSLRLLPSYPSHLPRVRPDLGKEARSLADYPNWQ
jgi:hypothetical protein